MVKVSVAIPTYNRRGKLRRLLQSIKDSSFKDYEIIVVDDASKDGTDEMIREEFPDVKYIRHERPTLVTKSRNDAIEASQGEFIFFVDDDNVVEKDTIEKLYNYISNHDEVGGVSPVTCYYHDPERVQYAGINLSRYLRGVVLLYSGYKCKELEGKVIEADVLANSYMVPKNVIKKIGPLSWKRIPWYHEDVYMFYKIKKQGYKNVTLGSARVYHDYSSEGKVNKTRLYYSIRSKIIFELDLEPLPQKIKFFALLPIYFWRVSKLAIKTNGMEGLKIVLEGLIDGIRKSEELKYV